MSTMKKHLTIVQMVKEFQCPGCTRGHDPETCSSFKLVDESNGSKCRNHYAGTNMLGFGRIALGLPKGFNRYGLYAGKTDSLADTIGGHMAIRLWESDRPYYNEYNVPVWRLERDGFLFVRVFHPRVNGSAVDVIQLGNEKASDIAGQALDAGKFFEDYD